MTKNMSYDQRLKFLDVPSLELRRLRADLYWCCKILFGLVEITSDVFSPRILVVLLAVTSANCIGIILQLVYVQTFLMNGSSMRGTICLKASILAHCSDSNERLNGFVLAILGSS